LNEKSENLSVLGNEKWSVSSTKETCWGPTIYCRKPNNRKLKAKIKMLQEKRILYEANGLKDDLIFVDEERVPRGIPKL
jgi:hypothetical protein